jgi:hypothetical protein
MKKKLHITERQMIKDMEQYLKQYDDGDTGERSTTACNLIVQIAIWGGKNLFEGVGILQEALLDYRETSILTLNEEENEEEN